MPLPCLARNSQWTPMGFTAQPCPEKCLPAFPRRRGPSSQNPVAGWSLGPGPSTQGRHYSQAKPVPSSPSRFSYCPYRGTLGVDAAEKDKANAQKGDETQSRTQAEGSIPSLSSRRF
jgi:hypothetical protein